MKLSTNKSFRNTIKNFGDALSGQKNELRTKFLKSFFVFVPRLYLCFLTTFLFKCIWHISNITAKRVHTSSNVNLQQKH